MKNSEIRIKVPGKIKELSPTFTFEYTEYEGGTKKQCRSYYDWKPFIDYLFNPENQLALRKCPMERGRNRINFHGTLMHSIFLPDGRIFDSTGFCWRDELCEKGMLIAEWKKF